MPKKIPEGFHTITPSLIVNGAAEAIELYKKALGATEDYRMNGPDGKVAHACLTVGNSKVFLADANPAMGENCGRPSQSAFYLYLEDVDSAYQRALKAGMSDTMAPQDMFWGDRLGSVKDKFGIQWSLATHVKDVSDQEMQEGQKKMFGNKAA